jgi:hypothetical protein
MDSELGRLYSDLKQAQDMLALCKAELDAARVFIMYVEARYPPGNEQEIYLLEKWLEACKRRRAGEHD